MKEKNANLKKLRNEFRKQILSKEEVKNALEEKRVDQLMKISNSLNALTLAVFPSFDEDKNKTCSAQKVLSVGIGENPFRLTKFTFNEYEPFLNGEIVINDGENKKSFIAIANDDTFDYHKEEVGFFNYEILMFFKKHVLITSPIFVKQGEFCYDLEIPAFHNDYLYDFRIDISKTDPLTLVWILLALSLADYWELGDHIKESYQQDENISSLIVKNKCLVDGHTAAKIMLDTIPGFIQEGLITWNKQATVLNLINFSVNMLIRYELKMNVFKEWEEKFLSLLKGCGHDKEEGECFIVGIDKNPLIRADSFILDNYQAAVNGDITVMDALKGGRKILLQNKSKFLSYLNTENARLMKDQLAYFNYELLEIFTEFINRCKLSSSLTIYRKQLDGDDFECILEGKISKSNYTGIDLDINISRTDPLSLALILFVTIFEDDYDYFNELSEEVYKRMNPYEAPYPKTWVIYRRLMEEIIRTDKIRWDKSHVFLNFLLEMRACCALNMNVYEIWARKFFQIRKYFH